MAIFIMLNNFFHDFSVAMLFVSLLGLSYIYRISANSFSEESAQVVLGIYTFFKKTILVAWIWIIVGGIIRTWAYEDYEWLPAAGRGQIAALIVKHILLVSFVIWGTYIQIRLKRSMKELIPHE